MLFLYCSFLMTLVFWLEKGKRFVDETMLTANSTPCHTVFTKMY